MMGLLSSGIFKGGQRRKESLDDDVWVVDLEVQRPPTIELSVLEQKIISFEVEVMEITVIDEPESVDEPDSICSPRAAPGVRERAASLLKHHSRSDFRERGGKNDLHERKKRNDAKKKKTSSELFAGLEPSEERRLPKRVLLCEEPFERKKSFLLYSLPTNKRVRNIVSKYEELAAKALREADERERALALDVDGARRERRRRAANELREKKAAKDRNACAKPVFTNVSLSPLTLALRLSCDTKDANFFLSVDDGKTWRPDDKSDVVVDRRNHKKERKVVVMAYAAKKHMANSKVSIGVFSAEPPRFLRRGSRSFEFDGLNARDTCSLCGAFFANDGAYVASNDEALCANCALAPLSDDNTNEKKNCNTNEVTVVVDAGAHRLWLSENVLFRGNTAEVLASSHELLEALAAVLIKYPSICIRLEGHTNSSCQVDCDGSRPCANNRCFTTFGNKGGALAFSLARADAVKASLLQGSKKIEADRLSTEGFAGARRVVQDTEAPTNFKNRRVEVHTLNF